MADLASLMKVAPITGAGFIGAQQSQERLSEALKQQELQQTIAKMQQEREQSSQMNPLLLQKQQLLNQTMQAELPGILEKLKESQLKNKATEGTLDTTIAATNAENNNKMDKEKYDQMGRMSQAFINMAPELEQVPAPARLSYMTGKLKSFGIDPNHPFVQSLTTKLGQNPDAMPDTLYKIGSRMGQVQALQNPAYLSHVEGAKIGADSAQKVANIHAGATLGAARIAADSREEIANLKAQEAAQKQTQVKNLEMLATMKYQQAAQMPDGDPHKQQLLKEVQELTAVKKWMMENQRPQMDAGLPMLPSSPNPLASGPQAPQPVQGKTSSGIGFKVVPKQ